MTTRPCHRRSGRTLPLPLPRPATRDRKPAGPAASSARGSVPPRRDRARPLPPPSPRSRGFRPFALLTLRHKSTLLCATKSTVISHQKAAAAGNDTSRVSLGTARVGAQKGGERLTVAPRGSSGPRCFVLARDTRQWPRLVRTRDDTC